MKEPTKAWSQVVSYAMYGDARTSATQSVSKTHLSMPHHMLIQSAQYVMGMAGEAAKEIERTRPETVKQHPEIPWVALKRVRDFYSHSKRYMDSNPDELRKKAQEVEKVMTFFTDNNSRSNMPTTVEDPLLGRIGASRSFIRGLTHIVKASQPGTDIDFPIPVTQTKAVSEVCDIINCPERLLPCLILMTCERDQLNVLSERLAKVSPFYKRAPQAAFRDQELAQLIKARNSSAHFDDMVKGTVEPGNMARMLVESAKLIHRINNRIIDSLPHADQPHSVAAYIKKQARAYENMVWGNTAGSPHKDALMDRTIDWLASHSKHFRTSEYAVVFATGRLLQNTQASKATEVLDYVQAHPEAIGKPESLLEHKSDIAPEIGQTLHAFVADVRKFSQTGVGIKSVGAAA